MKLWSRWKRSAARLKAQVYTLYYAYRDRRTPWYAKLWIALVVAYAASPIDLIPDFIPVFGLLDDLILLPLGIALAIKLIPKDVLEESRQKAEQQLAQKKRINRIAAVVIVLVWIAVAALVLHAILRRLTR